MKNSKEYSPKLTKLIKSLKRKGAVASPPVYDDPVEAVVYACVGEFTTGAKAEKIHRRLREHFVDMNDVRVTRPEEIKEFFDDKSAQADQAAHSLTKTLNAIFNKYHKVSLAGLTAEGKRQARKELEEIPEITPFVAAYTFLTALNGHAIPLTESMIDYLRQHELVHPVSTPHEIESFLERHIIAAEAYTFYARLRAEIEGEIKPANTKKTKTAKKKKAAKKKTPKK